LNLVLLSDEDFVDPVQRPGLVRLGGRRLAHVQNVHRLGVGARLTVGREGGDVGRGTIVAMSDAALELEVAFEAPPPAKLPLTLVLALPRPKVLNRVVAAATSLGVARIVLVNAWKVEKAYWSSPRLEPANLRQQCVLGLEQARDTVLPALELRRLFVPFVKEELPGLVAGGTALVAHPGATDEAPRAPLAGAPGAPVTLAIGPEGGFIDAEVASLREVGFRAVSLGARILRVETAVASIIGRMF
jgi:16S rRNA (uracil1498-N3)-methyltransferase